MEHQKCAQTPPQTLRVRGIVIGSLHVALDWTVNRFWDGTDLRSAPSDSRVWQAIAALSIMPIIPLWGIIRNRRGELRCECPRGRGCANPGKHPRETGWQQTATRDPAVVVAWFRRWPHMNFGGVTGDVCVIDVDVKRRKVKGILRIDDGPMMMQILEEHYAERFGHTVAVRSGRDTRCYHLYCTLPPGVTTGCRADVIRGVDVKGSGGIAVLPGSRHLSGVQYCWMDLCRPDEVKVAVAPSWLLERLSLRRNQPKAAADGIDADLFRLLEQQHGIDVSAVHIDPNAAPPKWKLDALLSPRKRNHGRILATWDYDRGPSSKYPLADNSSSAYELALATFAAANTWKPQEIADLLVAWRRYHHLPKDRLHATRLGRTLIKAYEHARSVGRLRGKAGRKVGQLCRDVETLLEAEPALRHQPARIAARLNTSSARVKKTLERLRKRGRIQ